MPRSIQAFRQNATVTNSPANTGNGDPSQAVDDGTNAFALPSMLDVCAPATSGNRNPFMAGLNTMGDATGNSTGVAGQTGNIMSGFQIFSDSICGFALGGGTMSEVIAAWRHIREQGGDPRETYRAVRRLRDTVGAGTTPQTVLAGVEGVSNVVNTTPLASGAIAKGVAAEGASGNQVIDGINGAQSYAGLGHLLLSGKTKTNASGDDLLTVGGNAINQNTSFHLFHKSASTAQSVTINNQNLLVSQDFSAASTVAPDPSGRWTWDGTDGDPATNVLGCLSVAVNGHQDDYVSGEIPVTAGETIEIAATVKWSGLTYTGASPIILGIQKYRLSRSATGSVVYSDIGGFNCATATTPGASSSGVWVGLAGTYTAEPGVDQIRMRFTVAKTATAGTVKWDNGEFLKLDLIADAAVPGVGTTVDNIVTNLYGSAGDGFTHNDAAVALANTAAALTSVSSQVANLTAEGHSGSIAGDDFNFTGPILSNANWTGFYHNPGFGDYEANNKDAAWVPATTFPTTTDGILAYLQWQGTDPVSTTDYQLVQLVLDGAPGADTAHNAYSSIWVFGRIATGFASYAQLVIGSDGSYGLWYLPTGGAPTNLTSGTCPVPGSGSTISFYCGDKTSTTLRRYKAEIGNTEIFDFTEAGTGSPVGSSNRGYGWGGAASHWKGALVRGYVVPPPINQWLGLDQ